MISSVGTQSSKFEYASSALTIPVRSYKAPTHSLGIDLYHFEGFSEIRSYNSPVEHNAKQRMNQLTSWFHRSITTYHPIPAIMDSLLLGKAFFATDGSYIDSIDSTRCSGAWLLVHNDGYVLLSGVKFLHYTNANAYVGELLGLLGSLLTLCFLLSKDTSSNYPSIIIHSDCRGALNWLWSSRRRIKNRTDHCGIIRGLAKELKSLSVQITVVYM